MTRSREGRLGSVMIGSALVAAWLVVGCGGKSGSGDASTTSGAGGAGGANGDGQATGGSTGNRDGALTDSGGGASCPTARPAGGTVCNVQDTCKYDTGDCICLDPGPSGSWQCSGPTTDAGNPAACPADEPFSDDPCTTPVQHCQYPDYYCDCDVPDGSASGTWSCLI